MNLIDLDKAKPGMTLAKSVSTLQDRLLLKSDVRLSEKNIHILKSWGIQDIWVNEPIGEDNTAGTSSGNALRATIDESLRTKFSGTLDNPLMVEILRIAGNLLEKRLQKKEKRYGAK